MPRRKWRLLNRREPLSEALRVHLEFGRFSDPKPEGWKDVHFFLTSVERQALWAIHRDAILSAWIAEHPGTRPWAWWKFEAAEPRRCVVGAELLMSTREPTDWEFVWRAAHGVPAFLQSRPSGYLGLPTVESQATYLDRLGLLAAEERSALADDALVPEGVDPFILDRLSLGWPPAPGWRTSSASSTPPGSNGTGGRHHDA
jgi:hypothetical protein